MVDNTIAERLAIEEALLIRKARAGLMAFTKKTMDRFQPNWHHRAICRALNYLEARRTPRELLASWGIVGRELERQLCTPHPVTKLYAGLTHPDAIDKPMRGLQVWCPPRHGKSEIVSRRLPAWWLGRNPNAQIIACSYSSDLSSELNRDVQRIIDDPQYASVFSEVRLSSSNVRTIAGGSSLRNSDIFEVVGQRGAYRSAGIGAGITGKGAHLGIIDDPIKNRIEANSIATRAEVRGWYNSTFYTRLEKDEFGRDAVIAFINTRWHELDLSGYTVSIAQANPNARQFFILVFPALLDQDPGPGDPRKPDEALWPDKVPAQELKSILATQGSYEFNAMFQQRPSPQGGGIINETWWRWYERLPEGLSDWTISADLAFKDRGDFCAFQVWAAKGSDRYLVDQVMDRMEFTQQLRTFSALCAKYPQAKIKLVEDAANGAALISTLKHHIPGIIGVRPQGSKLIRAQAVTPQIEAGNVYLPVPKIRPWIEEFCLQWAAFPAGAHDDAVDAASQALSRMAKRKVDWTAGLPIAVGERRDLTDPVTRRIPGVRSPLR